MTKKNEGPERPAAAIRPFPRISLIKTQNELASPKEKKEMEKLILKN